MKLSFHQKFLHYVRKKNLFNETDKLLLAVSGGMDSSVLAHLLKQLGFNFGIVHCNFKLRGEESDNDEIFVLQLAEQLSVPVYVKHFDTSTYAEEKKLSIQMAARELRYEWFNEVLQKEQYDLLLTAHHKDDLAETILLNLARGSVLRGLHGISAKNGNIIRPLLWASRAEISKYVIAEKIEYREDSSNESDKYKRNHLRHHILPEFEKINPAFTETLLQTSELREQIFIWFEQHCTELKNKLFIAKENVLCCNKNELLKLNEAILFEMIREYGFITEQAISLFQCLQETESKEFSSVTHRIIMDRDTINILPLTNNTSAELIISEPGIYEYAGKQLSLEIIPNSPEINFREAGILYLDADKIKFPLTLRKWTHGDAFIPYGMSGNKKVSDYLTDIKMPAVEKEKQSVLLFGNMICCLPSLRIDDRFKVEKTTGSILRMQFV